MRHKIVKTRKPHVCHCCQRRFPASSSMLCYTGVQEGHIFNIYYCLCCTYLVEKHADELIPSAEEGIPEGAARELAVEYGIENIHDLITEIPKQIKLRE